MITQDSAAIIAEAGEIRTNAAEFMKKVEAFYAKMKEYIGEEKSWSGPRAQNFLTNAEAKMTTFNSAKANLDSLANNLEEQGQAWAGFEGGAA